MIDVNEIRSLIDKHGPPLSPMLIFTLLDEIERLRAELAETRSENDELCAMSLELQAALEALARVRERCSPSSGFVMLGGMIRAEAILLALGGAK